MGEAVEIERLAAAVDHDEDTGAQNYPQYDDQV